MAEVRWEGGGQDEKSKVSHSMEFFWSGRDVLGVTFLDEGSGGDNRILESRSRFLDGILDVDRIMTLACRLLFHTPDGGEKLLSTNYI